MDRYQVRLLNFVNRTDRRLGSGPRIWCRKCRSVCTGIATASTAGKLRRGRTRSCRTLAKNDCATGRGISDLVLSRRSRELGRRDRPLQIEDSASRPDDLYRKRHRAVLVEVVGRRPPKHHPPGVRSRDSRESNEEIAQITACNLGTVKSRRIARGTIRRDHRARVAVNAASRHQSDYRQAVPSGPAWYDPWTGRAIGFREGWPDRAGTRAPGPCIVGDLNGCARPTDCRTFRRGSPRVASTSPFPTRDLAEFRRDLHACAACRGP